MKIIFSSQFRDSSGYASAARSYLKAIDSINHDRDFQVLSISVEQNSFVTQEEENLISKYEIDLADINNIINEDYILVWHQPAGMVMFGDNHLKADPKWQAFKALLENSTYNINMTVWEADKVPDFWKTIYTRYKTSACIVPCQWNAWSFTELGMKTFKLPHVITEKIVNPLEIKNFPIDLDKSFSIFSMSQWINRKGFDSLIKAYCMEFNNNDDAVLIIKTYINAMSNVNMSEQLKHIINQIRMIKSKVFKDGRPSTAKIIPICNILPFKNISWLYDKSDVFALATRGEGFGLTISEAIMHGKPVIVPDVGGQQDYVDPKNNFLFKTYKHPYLEDPTYDYDMNWNEPDILSLREKLRESYEAWKEDRLKDLGQKSKDYVLSQGFDQETIAKQFFAIIDNHSQNNIHNIASNKKKIELLKNKHEGEDCYILTCGPSLKDYDADFLKEKLKDKKVFAVKQAFNHVPEIIDYHFFNSNNFEVYDYSKNKPFTMVSSAEDELAMIHHIWTNKQEYDVFTFIEDDRDFSKSICKSLNFEDYTFDKQINRPWGPGMMTELVIYAAVHMGFKNIYTIGWDLEKPGETKSNHFYENKNLIRPADPMKQEEILLNIEMTKHLSKWLKDKGINLYVANENSYVHEEVERRLLK